MDMRPDSPLTQLQVRKKCEEVARRVIETDSVRVEKGGWVYSDDWTHRQTENLEEYRRHFGGNPWE
jgi:hypothetical protein